MSALASNPTPMSDGLPRMRYEVWDVRTASLLISFATEEEALIFLRRTIAAFGDGFAADYLLCQEDRYGRGRLIGEGEPLVALAIASGQDPTQAT